MGSQGPCSARSSATALHYFLQVCREILLSKERWWNLRRTLQNQFSIYLKDSLPTILTVNSSNLRCWFSLDRSCFYPEFPQYYHIRVTNRLINFLKLLWIGNVPNMVNQGTIKICFLRIWSHSFFFTHTSVYGIHPCPLILQYMAFILVHSFFRIWHSFLFTHSSVYGFCATSGR